MDGKELVRQIEIRLSELGMKKKDFYALTGISSAAYSYWNTGRSQPSLDALARIDAVLGTSFKLSNKTDNMYDTIQMLQNMRDSERGLLEAVKNRSDRQIRLLIEFAKNMKGEEDD